MKKQTPKILMLANVACLVLSCLWMIASKFDYEPIIVTIGFVVTLLIQGTVKKIQKNTANQEGDNTQLEQTNSGDATIAINKATAKGNGTIIKQGNR